MLPTYTPVWVPAIVSRDRPANHFLSMQSLEEDAMVGDIPFSKASYATSSSSLLAGSIPEASFGVTEKKGASNIAVSCSRK